MISFFGIRALNTNKRVPESGLKKISVSVLVRVCNGTHIHTKHVQYGSLGFNYACVQNKYSVVLNMELSVLYIVTLNKKQSFIVQILYVLSGNSDNKCVLRDSCIDSFHVTSHSYRSASHTAVFCKG